MHKVAELSIKGTEYFFSIYSKPVCKIKAIDGIMLQWDIFCDLVLVVDFVSKTIHIPHTVLNYFERLSF